MEVDPKEDSLAGHSGNNGLLPFMESISTLPPVNNRDDTGGEPTPPFEDVNNAQTEPVPIEQEEAAGANTAVTASTGNGGDMGEEPGDQELGTAQTGTNEVCLHVIHYLPSYSSTELGLLVVLQVPQWRHPAHVLILPPRHLWAMHRLAS